VSTESDAPELRTLVDPELLPVTTLVFASLGAAGWLAGYAVSTGEPVVAVAALVAVMGPASALKHIENEARELEGSDA